MTSVFLKFSVFSEILASVYQNWPQFSENELSISEKCPKKTGTVPNQAFFATLGGETESIFAKLRAPKLRNRPKLSKKSPKLRLQHFIEKF